MIKLKIAILVSLVALVSCRDIHSEYKYRVIMKGTNQTDIYYCNSYAFKKDTLMLFNGKYGLPNKRFDTLRVMPCVKSIEIGPNPWKK